MLSFGVQSSYWHRLRVFVSPLLPIMLGLRYPFSQATVLPGPLSNFVYGITVVLVAVVAYRLLKRRPNVSMLVVVALVFPFLYAISAWTVESSDPRYLIVLTPVLALLLAQLAIRPLAGVALVLAVGAVTGNTLHNFYRDAQAQAAAAAGAPADFKPLIRTLDRLGVHYVYSTHWVAYRLAFETNERIIAVKNDMTSVTFAHGQAQPALSFFIRYPPYERKVAAGRHAFVFYRDSLASIPIVKPLERYGYRPHVVGGVVVYTLPPGR
jgi:hypothetical protein